MIGEGLLLGALIWLLGAAFIRSRKPDQKSAPDPPEPFYHPYTTAFDRVCRGGELRGLLAAEGRVLGAGRAVGSPDPEERQRQFNEAHARAKAEGVGLPDCHGAAICILLDQSGSMAPTMARVAGELLAVLECLEEAGADVMLAGFTTVGWKGGQSRAAWEGEGSPPYPGRLCDLLHVIYSDFGEASTPALFAPLLEPAIFFENVDGEAIQWAEQQLLAHLSERRCLIVVSDGAPVDDSTLAVNGPNFLWRHLVDNVSALRRGKAISLGGVGIDHDVASVYPAARLVTCEGGLATAIGEIATELLGEHAPPSD